MASPTGVTVLSPDILYMIFQYVGNRHTEDRNAYKKGQMYLLEASLANRAWNATASVLLWRNPMLNGFPSLLNFTLALQLSRSFNREGQAMGDWVKRLDIPAIPCWSVGGLPLMSKLLTSLGTSCPVLVTLKLDKASGGIEVHSLKAIFKACAKLTALRFHMILGSRELIVMRHDEDGSNDWPDDDSDHEESGNDGNGHIGDKSDGHIPAAYTSSKIPTELDCTDVPISGLYPLDVCETLKAGFAKLQTCDLAGITSTNRDATLNFLNVVQEGLGPNLTRCHLGGLEADQAHITLDHCAKFLNHIAISCTNLQILHVPIRPSTSLEDYSSMSTALTALSKSGSGIHSISIRHNLREESEDVNTEHRAKICLAQLHKSLPRIFSAFRHLTQLDLQGLQPTDKLLRKLCKYAPRTLDTLLMDIDAIPQPCIIQFVQKRGAQLRMLSLLSILTFPNHHILNEIARRCTKLVVLDLRHKGPDETVTSIVQVPLPAEWIASLRTILQTRMTLQKLILSWVPRTGYSDTVLDLAMDYPNVVVWDAFP
ncbi:hypothetical protein SpCBS45565_g07635 [Spizellomyces sp. 'palustris']|nr:hypothetical protein SpCBS45565_g07635 [Spizellomyces sp. 'palustris']